MSEQYLIYYIIGLAVLALLYAVYLQVQNKKRAKALLAEYPDTARLKLKNLNWLIYTKTTEVHSVDNETPVSFFNGIGSAGYYLTPGTHELQVSFTKERPGILHKKVITTYDPVTISVTAEPNKDYLLYFDTKTEQYVFEEVR